MNPKLEKMLNEIYKSVARLKEDVNFKLEKKVQQNI